MMDFLKEFWVFITTTALGFLWLGGLETRIKKLEDELKNDPVMKKSTCALQHIADGKIKVIQDDTFRDQMTELKTQIKENDDGLRMTIRENDEKLRSLIESRHSDLIFIIKSFYERQS